MRWVTFFISVVFFILGAFLLLQGKAAAAIVGIIGGGLCYSLARLEQFKTIKAWKFEAELWEQKKEELNTVLDHLREAVTVISQSTLTGFMAQGFWGNMPLAMRFDHHRKIISNMRGIGASEAQISRAEEDWRKGICLIYESLIRRQLLEKDSSSAGNLETLDAKKQAHEEIKGLLDFEDWNAPTPDQIRSALANHSIQDEAVESWIKDYEYFLEKNEISRVEKFIAYREGK